MSELTDLDTRAAESIMGWTAAPFPPLWAESNTNVWQPTINIEQAWQCLEVMNSYQGVCSVAVLSFDKSENRWYAEVRVADKIGVTAMYTTGWSTAPEAIVRACLKAKEFIDAKKTKDETG